MKQFNGWTYYPAEDVFRFHSADPTLVVMTRQQFDAHFAGQQFQVITHTPERPLVNSASQAFLWGRSISHGAQPILEIKPMTVPKAERHAFLSAWTYSPHTGMFHCFHAVHGLTRQDFDRLYAECTFEGFPTASEAFLKPC